MYSFAVLIDGSSQSVMRLLKHNLESLFMQAVAIGNGANIVRVHNVALISQTVKVVEAISGKGS